MKAAEVSAPMRPSRLAGIRIICGREFTASFDSPIAATTVIAFLLVASSLYMNEFFLIGQLEMNSFFERLPLLFALFLPALSMRAWSEEKSSRTFELLVTLPYHSSTLVIGKWLASTLLLVLALAASTPIVAMLISLGDPDLARIAAGYLAALLLGAWLLAIGSFLSALTQDQVVAFVATAFLIFVLISTGDARVVAIIDGWAPSLGLGHWMQQTLSALPHYERMIAGLVDTGALLYFGGGTAAALFATAHIVARERS
ncbi:MAG: ABC-2 type transport system permease protein [Planctomycetota bacterium]